MCEGPSKTKASGGERGETKLSFEGTARHIGALTKVRITVNGFHFSVIRRFVDAYKKLGRPRRFQLAQQTELMNTLIHGLSSLRLRPQLTRSTDVGILLLASHLIALLRGEPERAGLVIPAPDRSASALPSTSLTSGRLNMDLGALTVPTGPIGPTCLF